MRILTKYVLVELSKLFLISLTGLTMMMILVGMVREAMQQSLPLDQVLRLIPYILPDALRVAVPVTLLLATTFAYGRMSGANEVVAAKALGISPMALLWPTLVVAFLLSLVTVWLNDLAVSWGRNGARKVVIEALEEIVYGMLKAERSYSTSSFSINVKGVRDRLLIRPTVTVAPRDGAPTMTIIAEAAELYANFGQATDLNQASLKIRLLKGTFNAEGKARFDFPDVWELDVPIRDASRAQTAVRTPSWLRLSDIHGEELQQRQHVHGLEQELAARAALEMLSGDFEALTGLVWDDRLQYLDHEQGHLYRLLTEPHRRWSAGFSCLCFAFVGAPMAIRRQKGELLTNFFLCFSPILIVYYPLLAWGVEGAKNGNVPPYAVWAGNVLMLAWGAWLLRRVVRY